MYKISIIGAGNIALGYNRPGDSLVLTHLKGYQNNNDFNPVSIYDIDYDKALSAAKEWKIPIVMKNINELEKIKPDVVSICTPDSTHYDYLMKCIEFKPKLVFCEKPIAMQSDKAKEVVDLYSKNKIKLAINYSRRWIKEITDFESRIKKNEFGKILSCRIKYYKGFFHNASHLLDLISFFLKPNLKNGAIISEIDNGDKNDPTINAACFMESAKGNFTLMIEGYEGKKISPLELEFIFENARILMEELEGSWITFSRLKENSVYPGFYEFSDQIRYEAKSYMSLPNALENILDALSKDAQLNSTGETALDTLYLCEKIKCLKTNTRYINV